MNWIEYRIAEARDKKLTKLDLSYSRRSLFSFDEQESFDVLTQVPNEVFKLTDLTELDLGGHRLKEIPDAISDLKNLEKISFSENVDLILPITFQSLTKLYDLDLSGIKSSKGIIAHLPPNIKRLNISFADLESLPRSLLALQNLEFLDAYGIHFDVFPHELSNLPHLAAFNISLVKKISRGDIARCATWKALRNLGLSSIKFDVTEITKLQYLESISLWNIDAKIPSDIFLELPFLRSLNLSAVERLALPVIRVPATLSDLTLRHATLYDFPEAISSMTHLSSLSISLSLPEIPKEIFSLHKLINLALVGSNVSTISPEISRLENLENLNLSSNPIIALPDEIGKLGKLSEFWLAFTQFHEFPAVLSQLKLQSLSLHAAPLNHWPLELLKMSSLRHLVLSETGIRDLPNDIGLLEDLEVLDVSRNQIKKIPTDIRHLKKLKGLIIDSKQIISPPPEIVERGTAAIQGYFHELLSGDTVRLHEAKLIVVGEGEVGKTCLSRKLIDPDFDISRGTEDLTTTRGIEIRQWKVQVSGQQFTVNLWDFGGQEIYHATHQFFLTKRSLYLYVWDARKEDKLGSFDFWLSVVTLLSAGSPIIVVLNKADERIKEIDQKSLKEKFANIVSFREVSVLDNRGMADLRSDISRSIAGLPHIGDEWPIKWSHVRKTLIDQAAHHEFIESEDYLEICRSAGLNNAQAKFLSTYLHDLGVILHFQDDPILERIVILRPEWGTNAVYAVLDTPRVQKSNGRFTLLDLKTIWGNTGYPESKYTELLQLMMRFELCFRLGTSTEYVAPELLPSTQPNFAWDSTDNLKFEYQYAFMPSGLITRFISRQHELIERDLFWKNGVLLVWEQTRALVVMEPFHRKIRIALCGDDKKALLSVIRRDFMAIHRTLNNPEVVQMIPCSCSECQETEPFLFNYDRLKKYLAKGETTITCDKSITRVSINALLTGVFSQEEIIEDEFYRGPAAGISPSVVQIIETYNEVRMDSNDDNGKAAKNPWLSGTFYVFAAVVILASLGTAARILDYWLLVTIIVGGLIFVTVIGALQLRQDDRLSEKSFLKLLVLSFRQLPLLGKFAKGEKSNL